MSSTDAQSVYCLYIGTKWNETFDVHAIPACRENKIVRGNSLLYNAVTCHPRWKKEIQDTRFRTKVQTTIGLPWALPWSPVSIVLPFNPYWYWQQPSVHPRKHTGRYRTLPYRHKWSTTAHSRSLRPTWILLHQSEWLHQYCTTDGPRFNSQQEQGLSVYSKQSRPALGPTQPPVKGVQDVFFWGKVRGGGWTFSSTYYTV